MTLNLLIFDYLKEEEIPRKETAIKELWQGVQIGGLFFYSKCRMCFYYGLDVLKYSLRL